jgi:Protein of unknown function (DUF3365)
MSGSSLVLKGWRIVLASVVATASLAACAPRKEIPDPALVLAARKAAVAFETKLKMDIIDRLDRDEDPVAVYQAYVDHVPGYAKEISKTLGIDFSRTAERVRNPDNGPDDWERDQLELFKFLTDAGIDASTLETAEVVKQGKTREFRWIRPLVMGEPCMVCHGDQVDPKILKLLAQEYPLDEATGYYSNEVGGAYSVRILLEPK